MGKVVKYTVFLPIFCLLILAIKGIIMPGAIEGLRKFFVSDFSSLSSADIWIDAIGQVFYSLSIMMAIMVAYGSFLNKESNIAKDAMIIAFSDFAISVLSGIVLFTTMSGTGQLGNMTASGIGTAFIVYPQSSGVSIFDILKKEIEALHEDEAVGMVQLIGDGRISFW